MNNMEYLGFLKTRIYLSEEYRNRITSYLNAKNTEEKEDLSIDMAIINNRIAHMINECSHPLALVTEDKNQCSCLVCCGYLNDIKNKPKVTIRSLENGMFQVINTELERLLQITPEIDMPDVAVSIQEELNKNFTLSGGRK